ncbi:hypothetical protein [Fumia xinanensis]|uniref:Uncharacterized protein n=1 Tax=Fumia xinanensis TaxID=2763659 RepID=A0A926E6W3_9FIRM|nr:hypothetical protein [Fumia xinanensis]MBC8560783.1 hypothetical protein [Fumia xinanensis]
MGFQPVFRQFPKNVIFSICLNGTMEGFPAFSGFLCGKFVYCFGKSSGGEVICPYQSLYELCSPDSVKLPICHFYFPPAGLRYIEQVRNCQPGVLVITDGDAFRALVDASANPVPLFHCRQRRNVGILCVYKQGGVKIVLMDTGSEVQIIPPGIFASHNHRCGGLVNHF